MPQHIYGQADHKVLLRHLRRASKEQEKVIHRPPSFRKIFDLDLKSSGGSVGFDLDGQRVDNGLAVKVPVRFIYDTYAQTKFLAVFVKREYPGRQIYDFVGSNLAAILKSNVVHMTTMVPGNTAQSSSANYIFTNVIYFYAEDDMPLADQAAVERAFRKIGVKIQILGQAYYTLHWNDAAFQNPKDVGVTKP